MNLKSSPYLRATTLLLVACAAVSCRTTEQFAGYAKAGTAYATAMDKLLVATSQASIDKHSEQLISARGAGTTAPASLATSVISLNEEDAKMVALLSQLQAHTQLLGSYFEKIYEVATSDEPAKTATSADALATAANNLGDKLRGQTLIPISVSPLTKLVVSAKIRGALNKELTARADLIRKEIATQQVLLDALAKKISHDIATTGNLQLDRLVNKPLTGPVLSNPDKWIKDRQAALSAPFTSSQLDDASQTARKLNEAFEELLKGGDTHAKINAVIADSQTLASVAESLLKKN